MRTILSICKKALGYVLLIAFGVLLAYGALEYIIAPAFAHWLPLKFQGYVPEGARILMQSSKKGAVPENYIAIAGDSYAHGFGDWLLSADTGKNSPFNSAHVLHEATGRDVVTFGFSGAGSITGLVAKPAGQLVYVNTVPLMSVDDPDLFLVYFDEGNDLQDNLLELEERFYKKYADSELIDEELFQRFLKEDVVERDKSYRAATTSGMFGPQPFSVTVRHMVEQYLSKDPPKAPRVYDSTRSGLNFALQNGSKIELPDKIQGPPLELSAAERKKALHVLEHSLKFLRARFPNSRVGAVYIPSPASCYELTGEQVSIIPYRTKQDRFPVAEVTRLHNELVSAVEDIFVKNGGFFLNPTGDLRTASRAADIHGPVDWKHFNKAGYTLLGQTIANLLPAKLDNKVEAGR